MTRPADPVLELPFDVRPDPDEFLRGDRGPVVADRALLVLRDPLEYLWRRRRTPVVVFTPMVIHLDDDVADAILAAVKERLPRP